MAEELGERTEYPTGRRLNEARDSGQVAKSQDLASAVDMASAIILIVLYGGAALGVMGTMLRRVLEDQTAGPSLDIASVRPLAIWVGAKAMMVLGPGLLATVVTAFLAHLMQVGWHVTTRPLTPNFARLNPLGGVKKFFNVRNMIKTLINTYKLAMVGLIAFLIIRRHLADIAALPVLGVAPGLYKMGAMALELGIWLVAIFLSIGLIDFLYQRWQHVHDLRMTRQEVKDERRSVEGDPDVKARRYRMAREISMQRIQHAVPKADVIVTNPTHFVVALRYDQDQMRAPRVIAKGADFLALKIRQVAVASGVPIVERPPLARGLYWGVHLGQEISPEYYEAVAEVLAYVYRIKGRAA